MAQPQRYGSIREFLDNLPRQPCIWQPENQNICVTCLRINEPVARVCSVWSQALDDAPLEELDFEEEMRSLPAVEKVAESPATPGLVEIDVVGDWDMEPATVTPVAAEPAVVKPAAEQSIAVVDIDMVPPTEPAVTEEPAAEETEPAEVGDAEEDEPIAAEAVEAEAETIEVAESEDAEEVVAEAVSVEETEAGDDAFDEDTAVPEAVEVEAAEDAEEVAEAAPAEADAAAVDAPPVGTWGSRLKFWGGAAETPAADEPTAAESDDAATDADEPAPAEIVDAEETDVEPEAAPELEEEAPVESESEVLPSAPSDAPFAVGEVVNHDVYGGGTVHECIMTGNQWSVSIDFNTGPRTILSHFLEGESDAPESAPADDSTWGRVGAGPESDDAPESSSGDAEVSGDDDMPPPAELVEAEAVAVEAVAEPDAEVAPVEVEAV
ncbi:MAG TPA: hypothetical protein EYG25_03955, partial [Candidatus Poseidoniales archaeon]|nr:hypothetical protein [Candidatus Poseidoniales archaeon]